jgi:S1-C subfamily serine protease
MTPETATERLYRDTIPSVVSIYVTADTGDQRTRQPGGAGSGFVFEPGQSTSGARATDGHVVTNQHVVGAAREVDVRFSDGQWHVGEVVGTDAYTDLAVVRVEDSPDAATPLPLASTPPAPGRPVAALGNPMGLDGSISTGIVSGANRSMPTSDGYAIPDTVQTDAPINPGNSGGPLVTVADPDDGAGAVEVVGVNRARAGDNIGFAVSAAVVARVAPALASDGRYRHPHLRIRTIDVSPTVAEANGLADPGGVLVVDVRLGPASAALIGCRGARRVRGQQVPVGGDVLTAIDGQPIDSHEQLMRHLLLETRPGEDLTVRLVRDGTELTERVTLAERPAPQPPDPVRVR